MTHDIRATETTKKSHAHAWSLERAARVLVFEKRCWTYPRDGSMPTHIFVSTVCDTSINVQTAWRATHLFRCTERRMLNGRVTPNTLALYSFSPLRNVTNHTTRSRSSPYKDVVYLFINEREERGVALHKKLLYAVIHNHPNICGL